MENCTIIGDLWRIIRLMHHNVVIVYSVSVDRRCYCAYCILNNTAAADACGMSHRTSAVMNTVADVYVHGIFNTASVHFVVKTAICYTCNFYRSMHTLHYTVKRNLLAYNSGFLSVFRTRRLLKQLNIACHKYFSLLQDRN